MVSRCTHTSSRKICGLEKSTFAYGCPRRSSISCSTTSSLEKKRLYLQQHKNVLKGKFSRCKNAYGHVVCLVQVRSFFCLAYIPALCVSLGFPPCKELFSLSKLLMRMSLTRTRMMPEPNSCCILVRRCVISELRDLTLSFATRASYTLPQAS
jgi:hypothetical protein